MRDLYRRRLACLCVRRRAWVALACLGLGILFGLLGRVAPGAATWNLLAGLLVLAALALGLTLLGLGRRLLPGLAPMPDLFERPRPNERWCLACGHPTGANGPCRACGHTPVSRAAGRAAFQRKPGAKS